jgi:CspA family cold shock protein
LSVFVGQGQKGRQITRILSIGDGVVTPSPSRDAPSGPQPARVANAADSAAAIDMLGTVKWFTLEKGMGFVEVDGGGKDVFVHISVVERAQLSSLAEGQRVAMRVVETQKGRQAVSISPAD